jgi:hypothetical protein
MAFAIGLKEEEMPHGSAVALQIRSRRAQRRTHRARQKTFYNPAASTKRPP